MLKRWSTYSLARAFCICALVATGPLYVQVAHAEGGVITDGQRGGGGGNGSGNGNGSSGRKSGEPCALPTADGALEKPSNSEGSDCVDDHGQTIYLWFAMAFHGHDAIVSASEADGGIITDGRCDDDRRPRPGSDREDDRERRRPCEDQPRSNDGNDNGGGRPPRS